MLTTLLALTLAVTGPAARPGEDAAHRADRLRTEQLNRAAAARVVARRQQDDRLDRSYRAKQTAYEKQMAAWRDREAARQRHNTGLRRGRSVHNPHDRHPDEGEDPSSLR